MATTPPPAHPAPADHSIWAMLAGPSGKVSFLGVLLLVAAFGITALHGYSNRTNTACLAPARTTAVAPADLALHILAVNPGEWQFSKRVCVIVDNVASAAQLAKLHKAVADAEAAVTTSPLAQRAAARSEFLAAQSALTDFTKGFEYRLYLNGEPSTLTAHAAAIPGPQPLAFTVKSEEDATTETGGFWRDILAQPTRHGRIPIETGTAPKEAAAPAASLGSVPGGDGDAPITFLLYEPLVMWLAAAGTACLLIGLCGLAYDTPLLRVGATNLTPYSLSRVQMAFWLVFSTVGFVYVWLVTGQYLNVFPPALFVLIGISGATAGAAAVFDTDRKESRASRSFLHDIVGNWVGGEVQLHRIQIIAWTLILGLIFAWNVAANLKLVSFDSNLLLLAGVANGVYLTMKSKE